ncbi:hypothetical protein NKG94_12505 [Micromonospora sp. M12]
MAAIAGAPGVGKTALAVHWAHRARPWFTDGDLYVDMRGYGPGPLSTSGRRWTPSFAPFTCRPNRSPRTPTDAPPSIGLF